MQTVADVQAKLAKGARLILAGDKSLLQQLPSGCWIGGTISYFSTRQGALFSQELIHVTELPDWVSDINIRTYDTGDINQVYSDAPEHGFTFIIVPAQSQVHFTFALNAPTFANFAKKPLIGWISGTRLDESHSDQPYVFNGETKEQIGNRAIVMHVHLPPDKIADIGIINIFEQGDGDDICFPESGFSSKYALINGVETLFSDYLRQQGLDTRLPLVSDYYGTMISTAFRERPGADGEVRFYNAVFDFLTYRHAKPVTSYQTHFQQKISHGPGIQSIFSCNCILNQLYAGLEGRQVDGVHGPATFGEIAYQTLNQTIVYLRLIDLRHS